MVRLILREFNAPSAAPDGKGGVIVIFNMNPGRPTEGWNQIMTLPRRLTLISKDELGQEPAGEMASLRYDARHIEKNEASCKPGDSS